MRKQLIFTLAMAASLPVLHSGCASTSAPNYPGYKSSPLEKMSSSVKSGSQKAVALVTPKKKSSDPTSVETTNSAAGVSVFVASAQLAEQRGKFDEAEAQYNKALDKDPNNLDALIGMAHLNDRQSKFEAATKLYQKALKKHPKEAAVHNDLGLCYHRRAMLPEAAKSLKKAADLKPDRKLYRDNLAAILVDQGKKPEALKELVYAHGEAVGNYNLAYLLAQKKNNKEAIEHFQIAAQKDPSLTAASQWIAKLSSESMIAGAGPQGVNASFASTASGTTRMFPASTSTNGGFVSAQTAGAQATPGVQLPPNSRPSDAGATAAPPVPEQASAEGRSTAVFR